MKLYKYNILKFTKLCIIGALSLLFIAPVTSCSDDDEEQISDPYVELGLRKNSVDNLVDDSYELTAGSTGESSVSYFIFSNLSDWTIETQKAEDATWVEIWPKEGKKDGRFYVKIYENQTLEARSSKISIVSEGKAYRTFSVNQSAGSNGIWLSMSSVSVESPSNEFLITVKTNTSGWIATSDVSWLKITRQTDTQLGMEIDANTGTADRVANVAVTSMDNPNVKATFKVTQKKPVS